MIVTLNHVHLSYKKNDPVLEDINLTIDRGSFHFLSGESGAGKTSLLRLIYGAEKPNKGNIVLLGKQLDRITPDESAQLRRRLGFVFQDFRLIPHLTAIENAALPLRLTGVSKEKAENHVKELLSWVGLESRMEDLPKTLSGGEQQRVAIARAVVNKPDLLLADEPTGNIDSDSAIKLLHLFGELHKMGTTIILATHQQHLLKQTHHPVLNLKNGIILPHQKQAA